MAAVRPAHPVPMMTTFSIERRKVFFPIRIGKYRHRWEVTDARASNWSGQHLFDDGRDGDVSREFRNRRSSRGVDLHSGISVAPITPFFYAEENNSKKKRAAAVDSDSVSELVGASRVEGRVNRHVAPEEQGRHRARHQRAVNDAASESRRMRFLDGTIEHSAKHDGDEEHNGNSAQDGENGLALEPEFDLSRGHIVSKSMFLSERAKQAEYFDSPERSFAETAESYKELARINRLFFFAEPFQRYLPRMLGPEKCRSLTLLDLGAGDGSLGNVLEKWAAKRGWSWRVTNLDLSPHALQFCQDGKMVIGSVLSIPFAKESFDVVIANQMTHHLASDEEICQHFREAWRVARSGILLSDIHRNTILYGLIWLILRAGNFPKHFREDGLLSVKRGFRAGDWRRLADQAQINEARVWPYFGARVMLSARKL